MPLLQDFFAVAFKSAAETAVKASVRNETGDGALLIRRRYGGRRLFDLYMQFASVCIYKTMNHTCG